MRLTIIPIPELRGKNFCANYTLKIEWHIKNIIYTPNLSCTGWTYSLRNLLRSTLIGCSPFSAANLSASVGSGSGISNLRRKAK